MVKIECPDYGSIFAAEADGDTLSLDDRAHMAAVATRAFGETIEQLRIAGQVTKRRVEIADRYARACAEYAVYHPIASKDGPVKKGPNGGDVFNFMWSAVEKINDRLAKFEDQLKLDLRHADLGDNKPPSRPAAADEYLDD